MIPALIIGREGSRGVPGKNTMTILGRPLMTYPILAAKNSRHVNQIFLSTDGDEIKLIGREHGLNIIDRPAELCSDAALVEDVVAHGYHEMVMRAGPIEMFVLLFCNSATITPGLIDKGIETLWRDCSLDSAVSVSRYNEFSPVRAKRISAEGLIIPYIDIDSIPNASCDRDSAEPCYFCDCSVWILRPQCTDLTKGILPFRWMGQKSFPLYQEGGLDIDHDYGIPMTEHWLMKNGFTETKTPYAES
jgi:CMP-N-acetylneuraminic acid synthetase